MEDNIIKFPVEEDKDYDIGISLPEGPLVGITTNTLIEAFSNYDDYVVEVVDSTSEEEQEGYTFARFIFKASTKKVYLLRHKGVILTALHPEA